jgi:glutamate dehydrogenase
MKTQSRPAKSLVDGVLTALTRNALPGETEGFTTEQQAEAGIFVADAMRSRSASESVVSLQSMGGEAGNRRMRLVTVNADMPFLVDSVAAAIAAQGIAIHRLLHPIIAVKRGTNGEMKSLGNGGDPESIIYMELDRVDARGRRELREQVEGVLEDVKAAVADWHELLVRLSADADEISGKEVECAEFLRWLGHNNFTLLGHVYIAADGATSSPLGIFRSELGPWDRDAARTAYQHLQKRKASLLILKSRRLSPVHRRTPLDIILVRSADGRCSLHAGLWTSAALRAPADEVPILRKRLETLDRELGFVPHGHAGKALAHAISTLPHDLLVAVDERYVRVAALTAMSLVDRPRPKLLLLTDAIDRHLYVFAWIPRDQLSTERRKSLAAFLEREIGSTLSNWSVELDEGELALLRYTFPLTSASRLPDVVKLDQTYVEMVRGWAPSVEAELVRLVGSARATRLALGYIAAFPEGYQSETSAEHAAVDIIRLSELADDRQRAVRMWRSPQGAANELRLKTYARGGLVPLSEVVPVLENFGFKVLDEVPTELSPERGGFIHDFRLELGGADIDAILARAAVIEDAIASVLSGTAENDEFNQLVLFPGLDTRAVVWLRAWFRYLRQTGSSFGLVTIVDALRRAPAATAALIGLFEAAHNPQVGRNRAGNVQQARAAFDEAIAKVRSIDDDRILRRLRSLVDAVLRTNAFAPAGAEALAFKIDSSAVPGLPAPVPWREIWVYSPRLEGIHLRGGPIARGGLRWSDRRDDFRTEILGLMKAQLVKNAVIVPTGAKGGFYPKQLPPTSDREAWLAEGTESYRIFIRSLLSVTDNLVNDKVVHPEGIVVHDYEDPYFVVAADKGTATFSDVANAISLERNFWLGDAFASGGSNGYDHKAMGITARGAWISVQRHFLELGVDVQTQPVRVVGCGDMSGDVFGNGMLLSQSIKLIAAFDHRHIFIDPDPDPAKSFKERRRLFDMPRSSWDDYDRTLISKGGGIYARTEKSIPLSAEVRQALGIDQVAIDPAALINAILKSPVDLIWFGGIGTYIKASTQSHADVGDPINDGLRADASEVRARAIGEGANLGLTQAARIEFAALGGRINTDFIDNSAGVDCSDNEVNIKIPLNREMREGRLTEAKRNSLLERMSEEVAAIVLEDNRLQTLALSVAESGGAAALPSHVRAIELLEASGRLNRKVEGLASSDDLLRRGQERRGLTRPELAVILSMSKLALQDAAEELRLGDSKMVETQLLEAFPSAMRKAHSAAIKAHPLRHEILATKTANRIVNRLGPETALELTEEEGASLAQVAVAFLVAERLLDTPALWRRIETAELPETVRIELFSIAASSMRSHIADIVRASSGETDPAKLCRMLEPGLNRISGAATKLMRAEVRNEAAARRDRLLALGAGEEVIRDLIRLFELDGAFGLAALAARRDFDELALARGYTVLGEALGLDWAQQQVARFKPSNNWERLLTAGLSRDFEQLRIDFLSRSRIKDPEDAVVRWVEQQRPRIDQFRLLVERARREGNVTTSMLAQIASQARILLAR